jgi:DNA-binding LytR/AlgR family response regulator
MKVLVIEDEIPAQEELVRILRKHFPNIEIVDIIGSVRDSVEWLRNNTADLIFMDIQLLDGCCFDIFDVVEVRTPIIFTTAYDQYALKAFKVNSVDYLLKPVDEDELVAAVRKMDYKYDNIRNLIESYMPTVRYKARISVKTGDIYRFLLIDEVAYFISEDGFTYAVTNNETKHIVDYTISSLETQLDPKRFFRLSRGCIVSIDSIEKITAYFNSRLKVTLKGRKNISIILSRVRVPDFLNWIDDK